MNKKDILVVLGILALITAIASVGYYYGKFTAEMQYRLLSQDSVRIDSIPYLVEIPSVEFSKEGALKPNPMSKAEAKKKAEKFNDKVKIIYRSDSALIIHDTILIKTLPFIAEIDTVVNGKDSMSLGYLFPDNIFSVALKREPEYIKVPNMTIYKTVVKEPAWWEKPLWIGGGLVVGAAGGYLLGSIGK